MAKNKDKKAPKKNDSKKPSGKSKETSKKK